MPPDIAARLDALRSTGAPQCAIEFFEMLLLVHDNPFLDGSLESEAKLFRALGDVDLVERVVQKREELRVGLCCFGDNASADQFEREQARVALAAWGYVEASAPCPDIDTMPRHRVEPETVSRTSVTYEVDDLSITKFGPGVRAAKRATPDFLKHYFGTNHTWSYIESKCASLLCTKKSSLIVVPLGFNTTGLAIIAAQGENSIYFVGTSKPVNEWQCGSADEIEKQTRSAKIGLLIINDAWDVVENREAVLVKLLSRQCRTVAFMCGSTNVGDVAQFLNTTSVLVFRDHAEIEYVTLKHIQQDEGANTDTIPGSGDALDAKMNKVVWDYCCKLPKPVLVVTHSANETLSCAHFMLRMSLDNTPVDVRGEYPKEIQNFLSHRIAVDDYVSDVVDFYVTEARHTAPHRVRAVVFRGTADMRHNHIHKVISSRCNGGNVVLERIVVVTQNDCLSHGSSPVRSNLQPSIHEAVNADIFNSPRDLSDVSKWFESTFFSLFFSINIAAVLLNLQRKGFVCYKQGRFEPTSKGCIAAKHKMKLGEIDTLYTVSPWLTDYKLFSLLAKLHPLDCEGDAPIPTHGGKLIQFMIVRRGAYEPRVLKLLSALFQVCVDTNIAAARLVLKYSKSIVNKTFACLTTSFGNNTTLGVTRCSVRKTGEKTCLSVLITAVKLCKVHVFVSDVADKILLSYQLVRVKSGRVDLKVPPRRFYNVFVVSDDEFWVESTVCIDADEQQLSLCSDGASG